MSKESFPQPQKGQGMTKEQIMARLKFNAEAEKIAVAEAKKNAAQAIKDAMAFSQVPGRDKGEPTGSIKERIVEPGRTPRSGSDERHKKRNRLKLQFEPDPDRAAFLNRDIFARIGNSLTIQQLQDKLGATETIKLLYLLNPGKDKIDKEGAAQTIRKNAFVIGPSLLEMRNASAGQVLNEIKLKDRIAKQFVKGSEDVEELCRLIEQEVKFPGWPAVSRNWKGISTLGSGREAILTPEYVMTQIGSVLTGLGAKIKNQVKKYEKMVEDERILLEKNKQQEKDRAETLRRATQTVKQHHATKVSARPYPYKN